MKWITPLYVGKTAEKTKQEIVRSIRHGRYIRGIYVLALPSNPSNQLDIYDAAELRKDFYKEHEPTIIGIAQGKSEAYDMVTDLLQRSIEETGRPDIRAYLTAVGKVGGHE